MSVRDGLPAARRGAAGRGCSRPRGCTRTHLAVWDAGFGIRLNKKPPEITFRKKDKGGINFTSTVQNPKLDLEGAPRPNVCGGEQQLRTARARRLT